MKHKVLSLLLFGAMLVGFCACEEPIDFVNGHEYVDLGLTSGTLWATCNVGATNPEEAGAYFAWGEIIPSTNYAWENYKLANGSYTKLTKYCNKTNFGNEGYTDELVTLEAADDAATANWGDKWRMPTIIEFSELRYECDWFWTDNYNNTGVNGYIVTSKKNGNSIFLPTAGYRGGTNGLTDVGSVGYYWSSSFGTNVSKPLFGQNLSIDINPDNGVQLDVFQRCGGLSVRPVCSAGSASGETKQTYDITLDVNDSNMGYVSGAGTYKKNVGITIQATAYDGYRFVRWSDGNTEHSRMIVVMKDITLTAIFEEHNDYEYVDLGLTSGLLWATCNIGATYPEGFGERFAWGETAPKTEYSWSTYVYNTYDYIYGRDDYNLTKYNTNGRYGPVVDKKTTLEASDDAATVNWGWSWRMPTKAEQDELLTECTWMRKIVNGINGYCVTGKNGNAIFLPIEDTYDYYWSSSLYESSPDCAYGFLLGPDDLHEQSASKRHYGLPIRPVRSPQ